MTFPIVTPTEIQTPFGTSAGAPYIHTVPVPSQIGITPGAASFTDGFPPLTMTDPLAGGIPPFGQDINGLLYQITAHLQNINAGIGYKFSATLAAAIGGYPVGTVLRSNDNRREYINISAGNSTDFNTTTSAIGVTWLEYNTRSQVYLDKSVAGGSNVTLNPLTESCFSVIDLTGAITANISVIVPTAAGMWTFMNTTTGAFAITVKTATGTGVIIPSGGVLTVFCDGANVIAVNNTNTRPGHTFTGTDWTTLGNGLALQWITGPVDPANTQNSTLLTWATPFAATPLAVWPSTIIPNASTGTDTFYQIFGETATQVNIQQQNTGSGSATTTQGMAFGIGVLP